MSLFDRGLTLIGLGVEGDTPGPGTTTVLPDGIHLRWLFEHRAGFPWHGYYVLRRAADSSWRRAIEMKQTEFADLLASFSGGNREAAFIGLPLQDDVTRHGVIVGTDGAEAREFFVQVGTVESAGGGTTTVRGPFDGAPSDHFALRTPLDLYGLSLDAGSRLRLHAPPPDPYRRVRLRLGFLRTGTGTVTAEHDGAIIERRTVGSDAGTIETVVIESDGRPFTTLVFDRMEAAVLDLDVVFALGDAAWALTSNLRESQPLSLPLTHPDYPARSGQEEPTQARGTASRRHFVLGHSFPNRVGADDLPTSGTVRVRTGSPLVRGVSTAWTEDLEGAVLQTWEDGLPHLVFKVLGPDRLVLARHYTGPLERAIAGVRERADLVEEAAGPDAARGLRLAADKFETALDEWWHEALTPTQAEQESPWTAPTIAKKIRQGELAQAGKSGAPKVRRGDLLCGTTETEPDVDDIVDEALGLVG